MSDAIRDAVRRARERLRDLGLPEDPAERWADFDRGIDRAQIALRLDASRLYDVVDFGERALAARAAGDWDGFAAALTTMVGAEIDSRLPQIRQTLHKQRQRKTAQGPRSSAKQEARRIYEKHLPADLTDFLARLNKIGLKKLNPKTVANWLTEFRQKKSNNTKSL